MHSISYILAALLSIASFVAADKAVLPDLEQGDMKIVTPVRHEQVSRSSIACYGATRLIPPAQALLFPHINAEESAGYDREQYNYVNVILSAAVPEHELEEAQDNPDAFTSTPLNERPWYEGLPADVKDYLAHMAKAEMELAAHAEDKDSTRFRGKGWWWA